MNNETRKIYLCLPRLLEQILFHKLTRFLIVLAIGTSKNKEPADPVSDESSFSALQIAVLILSSYTIVLGIKSPASPPVGQGRNSIGPN